MKKIIEIDIVRLHNEYLVTILAHISTRYSFMEARANREIVKTCNSQNIEGCGRVKELASDIPDYTYFSYRFVANY